MSTVAAVVQARMGSQRLPGKVLRPLSLAPDGSDVSVLEWVLTRLQRARTVDVVVLATSDHRDDDPLEAWCRERSVACHRGSLHDVLARVRGAAESVAATTVARVTADCPLVDPDVVDTVVERHVRGGHDFTANRLPPPYPRTYPIGLDVEVATMTALRRADEEAALPAHREHVMPFLYEQRDRFDVEVVDLPVDHGAVRWTIDTPEDLAAVRALVDRPGVGLDVSWRSLLDIWLAEPDLARLNGGVTQRTATAVDDRSDLDGPGAGRSG